jgi:hypothetical protein
MRRWAFVLGLLALPLLAAPTAGAAESPFLPPLPQSRLLDKALQATRHGGPVRPSPLFRAGFVAEAPGGYKFGVSTYGSGLYLNVWRGGKGRRTMTSYLARGVARPERLQATFGKFGKVSMRFHRSRNRAPGKSCRFGRTFTRQHGLFVGNLRFRGEQGYVSVRLHRAKGGILRVGKRCHVHHHPRFDQAFFEALFAKPEASMLAISREGVDSSALLAIAAKKKSSFFAVHEESRGKLAIIRLAIVHRPGKLRLNEALTAGSLVPPPPFRGTGRYRAFADGTQTWAGDLSVNFPGAPRFPLTGPSFETLLEVPF